MRHKIIIFLNIDNLLVVSFFLYIAGAKCTTCKRLENQYEEVLQEKETLEEENEELQQELEKLEGLINLQQQDAKKR